MTDLLSPDLANALASAWTVVFPALLVAALRVVDVTLNVFRTVFTVNGRKWLASVFHALEGGTWLAAAGIVLADVTVAKAIGYVAGIMAGTLLGTTIVERLRLGMVTVRIYADARHDGATGSAIATAIREAGFGATVFTGAGMRGPVDMILSTVPRRRASAVIAAAGAVSDDTIVAVDNDLQPLANAARV